MKTNGSMLAATYQQGGAFAIREVPIPGVGRDGLLLRVRAASICGTDVKIIRNGHRKLADGQRILDFLGDDVDVFTDDVHVFVLSNMIRK